MTLLEHLREWWATRNTAVETSSDRWETGGRTGL